MVRSLLALRVGARTRTESASRTLVHVGQWALLYNQQLLTSSSTNTNKGEERIPTDPRSGGRLGVKNKGVVCGAVLNLSIILGGVFD